MQVASRLRIGEDKAKKRRLTLPSAAALRQHLEQVLQDRIPSALTPRPAGVRETIPCGIAALDALTGGGFPVGAMAELVGPECSGRTSAALSFVAEVTGQGNVCAWIDVADCFDPEAAAANGVHLDRLLWVRCAGSRTATQRQEQAVPEAKRVVSEPVKAQPAPPAGGGGHPRAESRGMSDAVQALLARQPLSATQKTSRRDRGIGTPGAPNRPLQTASQRAAEREEQVATDRLPPRRGTNLYTHPAEGLFSFPPAIEARRPMQAPNAGSHGDRQPPSVPWQPLDRALRTADMLLQAGGFRAIVLDLGSLTSEQALRVPMATWFRFRAACERSRVSLLLLTQQACARSSAELVIRMPMGRMVHEGRVMTSLEYSCELDRQRQNRPEGNVIPMRRPPQSEKGAGQNGRWSAKGAWMPEPWTLQPCMPEHSTLSE